jgi:NADH-quinone oxidoreductase subunit L
MDATSRFIEFFTKAWANPQALSDSLWLIIALPAFGALVCGVFGKALGRSYVNLVACASVLASFVLSLFAFQAVAADRTVTVIPAASGITVGWTLARDWGVWFSAGSFSAHYGLWVDHLSATMLLVVTGVGFLIHLYSTAYMEHDEGYWRFFAYLNLFMAMMLTLVLADNLVLLFVGWEGVGLCSYLLIGFWYTDAANAWAGRKAFIANRVGDCAFILAMMLLVLTVTAYSKAPGNDQPAIFFAQRRINFTKAVSGDPGPLNFQVLEEFARYVPANIATGSKGILEVPIPVGPLAGHTYGHTITVIFLLLLLGAAGKSAQLPLYVWLPDAMAGPTPVSALIHAATMVTAGVYMLCRMSPLLVMSPTAMATVAMVGALTALYAAVIAFAQNDLKKVLAYSTISQLGYMFLGVGVGMFWGAILHLVTHAFFKGCLFLSAGSVMHGNAGELNVKKLGGLRKEMPWTTACFFIAMLAITGIVPLSGFFSKDDILHGALNAHVVGYAWLGPTVYALGSLGALCTAFYMARVYLLAFTGERSKDAPVPHAHESSWVMVAPLVFLATGSVLLLFWGFPGLMRSAGAPPQTVMEAFLRPIFGLPQDLGGKVHSLLPETEGSPWPGFAIALLLAWAGGGAAWYLYKRYFPSRVGKPVPPLFAWVHSFTEHKFYVDELYDAVIVLPIKYLSIGLFRVVDEGIIDGLLVGGTAWVTARIGSALRYIQTGNVQTYATMMAVGLLAGVGYALFEVLAK